MRKKVEYVSRYHSDHWLLCTKPPWPSNEAGTKKAFAIESFAFTFSDFFVAQDLTCVFKYPVLSHLDQFLASAVGTLDVYHFVPATYCVVFQEPCELPGIKFL